MNFYIQVYYIIFLHNNISIIWKIWDVTLTISKSNFVVTL